MSPRLREEVVLEQSDFLGQTLDADLVANFLEKALKADSTPQYIQSIRIKIQEFNEAHETRLQLRHLIGLYRGDTTLISDSVDSEQLADLTQWLERQVLLKLKVDQDDEDITVEAPEIREVYQAVKEFNQRAVNTLRNKEVIQAALEAKRTETYQGILIQIAELREFFEDEDIRAIVKNIRELPLEERRNFIRFLVGKTEGQLEVAKDVPLIEKRTGMPQSQLNKIWTPRTPSTKPTFKEVKDLILGLTIFERAPAELIRRLISEDGIEIEALTSEFNDLTPEQRRAFQLIFQYQMGGIELDDDYINSGLTETGASFIIETADKKIRRAQAIAQAREEDEIMAELEAEEDAKRAKEQAAEITAKRQAREAERQIEIKLWANVKGVTKLLNSQDQSRKDVIKEIIINHLSPEQVQNLVRKIRHTYGLRKAPQLVNLVQGKNQITLKGNQKKGIEDFLSDNPETLKPAYWDLIINALLRSARKID